MSETKKTIYDVADQILEAGRRKAEELGVAMVLTVVDDGGNLVAFRRMKGSFLASIKVSQGKAFTAVALHAPTHTLMKEIQPGASIYGFNTTNDGRIVAFGGGYPIYSDGELIGGFGMSGGTVEEDMLCAKTAIEETEGVTRRP